MTRVQSAVVGNEDSSDLARRTPGLIVVDSEEELSNLAELHCADVPRQRCLWRSPERWPS